MTDQNFRQRPLRRLLLLLLLPAILWPGTGSRAIGQELAIPEKQELFSQANLFFRQGNEILAHDPEGGRQLLEKATRRFEQLAHDHGVRNGGLYYNIGNCYFRLGDLGRAILNYRRAALYIPNDANLIQNLDYARSLRLDRIEEKPRTRVLQTLLFRPYDFSGHARLAMLAVCSALFWLALALRLPAGRRLVPRWLPLLPAIPLLILTASLGYDRFLAESEPAGVILAAETVGRKGDCDTYQPSFKEPLHGGTEFIVLQERSGWLQVELADGRRCWLRAGEVELVDG